MGQPKLVLLGAGNRVELLSSLIEAAETLEIQLDIQSIERSARVPIGQLIEVEPTQLDFRSDEFTEFLINYCAQLHPVILPLMDSSIGSVLKVGGHAIFPVTADSMQVLNKRRLKAICQKIGVLTPLDVTSGWAHVKPVHGNGGKGAGITNLDDGKIRDLTELICEEILEGPEVSVDVYIFSGGHYSAIARDRLNVVGGEVQHTRTRELTKLEKSRIDALLSEFTLMGPINVQFMGPDLKLLEINPRFGGGSTASIKAGWTATTWFLQEYVLGHSQVNQGNDFKHVEVMRAWKDYVWR